MFTPVAFLQGVSGRFFYEFGITVAVATVLSTCVALTLTPMLCSRYLSVSQPGTEHSVLHRVLARTEAPLQALTRAYGRVIEWSLAHRWWVVAATCASFVLLVLLLAAVGKNFMPEDDRGSFVAILETPEGSTLAYHERFHRQVEQMLPATPEVRSFFSVIGGAGRGRDRGGI